MDINSKSNQCNLPCNKSSLRLSSEAIKEFQEIYFKERHINISTHEADRLGMNLLRLFSVVYKPIKK